MIVRCDTCYLEYDDMDHETMCPHPYFRMHTLISGMVSNGAANAEYAEPPVYEEYVVTHLDDLDAVQEHFRGNDTNRFARIASQTHVHTSKDGHMLCTTPNISGRLIEDT